MTSEAGPIRDRSAPSAPVGPPAPGTDAESSPLGSARLRDFEILREIGRGGQSIVYEAQQLSLRRKVALKRLPSAAVFDQRWLARFQNEVRATAQLNHPHIVAFLEAGHDDDSYFYTMQLVDGISLAEVIRHLRLCRESVDDLTRPCRSPASNSVPPALLRLCECCRCPHASPGAGPPPAAVIASPARGNNGDMLSGRSYHEAVAAMIVEAARALDYAHEQGILHLDVKPSNLLMDGAGKIWLTDFGASRADSGDSGSRTTGGRVGTLRYMSPEQLLGRTAQLDRRSDVYSLGATLYELLTLARPFGDQASPADASPAAIRQSASPRHVNPAIPEELDAVVQKATAEVPDQRYATAGELADDLQRFLHDEPIQTRRRSAAARVARWARRHHAVVIGVLSMLAILLVASVIIASWIASRERALALSAEREHETDLKLLADFDRAWSAQAELDARRAGFDLARAAPILKRALREYGLAIGEVEPREAAAWIAQRPEPVRSELLVALQILSELRQPLGVRLRRGDGSHVVSAIWPDCPAARDGRLQVGDCVVAIGAGSDGPLEDIRQMTPVDVSQRLQGEPGTLIRFQFTRPGSTELLTATIQRDTMRVWLWAVIRAAESDAWRLARLDTRCLDDLQQRRAAIGELAGTADAGAQPVRALTDLAWELHAAGRNDVAIDLLKRAYEKHPDDFWTNEWLGVFLQPQSAEALGHAHAAVALRPDSAGVRLNRGSALEVLGRYEEATVQYREAVRLSPDYATAYNNLAWLLATVPDPQLRNPAEAVQLAVKAVELTPEDGGFHNTLGVAYYRAEKWQEAIASLQKSAELTHGGNATDWFFLAMASWKTGDQESARKWFGKAVAWAQKKGRDNAELHQFWTEAADLLGESRPDLEREGK